MLLHTMQLVSGKTLQPLGSNWTILFFKITKLTATTATSKIKDSKCMENVPWHSPYNWQYDLGRLEICQKSSNFGGSYVKIFHYTKPESTFKKIQVVWINVK